MTHPTLSPIYVNIIVKGKCQVPFTWSFAVSCQGVTPSTPVQSFWRSLEGKEQCYETPGSCCRPRAKLKLPLPACNEKATLTSTTLPQKVRD